MNKGKYSKNKFNKYSRLNTRSKALGCLEGGFPFPIFTRLDCLVYKVLFSESQGA